MPFVVEPSASIRREVPRIVRRRLAKAIDLLDETDLTDAHEVDLMVHGVRKHCKEVRAAARLVRPALGEEYDRFTSLVKEAADLLAPVREAFVMSGTFERLVAEPGTAAQPATPATVSLGAAAIGERVSSARALLRSSRKRVKKWELPDDFSAFEVGLAATYRRGRKGLRRLEQAVTDDERAHEWRTSVKQLWYQMQLLERAAPSVLGPYRTWLDELAELLGDDHDLAVLVAELEHDPERYGGDARTTDVREIARREQRELRQQAMRLGATIYAERTAAFVARIESYWMRTRELGIEPPARGPAAPAPTAPDSAPADLIERERKYLVARLPHLSGPGTELRQGYLAIDGTVSVRVRHAGTATLTIKAGHGAVRSEFEWPISDDEFEAAWTHTAGRRIRKSRHRIPVDSHIAELDVFHDDLDGLALVEVEFASDEAMASFIPPSWFGADVTDDESFTNASLATYALPGPSARR